MSDARRIALQHLERVEEGAFLARLGDDIEDAEVARMASNYVAGVTRHRRMLDFLIDHFYNGSPSRLDKLVRQGLRLGLYDLLVRETPPHAAVHEAVEVIRKLHHKGAAGLVNAILRSAQRAREADALPEPTGDEAERLAITHSHPTWLVRRWLDRYGTDETVKVLENNNQAPRFGVRANLLRAPVEKLVGGLRDLQLDPEPSRYIGSMVTVSRLQPVIRSGMLQRGLCSVQDEAAALVVHVLDPQPGERILDGAAAPGGKAVYAAERMQNQGRLHAVDVHPRKARLITRAAQRRGLTIIEVETADLRRIAPPSSFNRVLLDAPCTGTGVLSKRADLRWNQSLEKLDNLVRLQDDLLDTAAHHVQPGGLLVYSTCSLEPEENEHRVDAFLARHSAFVREDVGDRVPASMRTPAGDYQALPHRDATDGAYAARLRRTEADSSALHV